MQSIFSSLFESHIKLRGEAYFTEGLVTLKEKTDSLVSFKIKGTQEYISIINLQKPALSSCTCPYFESSDFCKHLWAAVLACEALESSKAIPTVKAQVAPAVIHWKRLIEISRYTSSYSEVSPRLERESFYVLSNHQTEEIRISLYFREIKTNRAKGPLRPASLSKKELVHFKDPFDQDFFSEMLGDVQLVTHEHEYDFYGPKEIRIQTQAQKRILNHLITHSKLYAFNGPAKSQNLVQILQMTEPISPYIYVQKSDDSTCLLHLRYSDPHSPENYITYLSNNTNSFILDGQKITLFAKQISSMWRNFFRTSNPFPLSRLELHEFILFSLTNPDEIKISFAEDLGFSIKKIAPTPEVHVAPLPNSTSFSVDIYFAYSGTLVNFDNESLYIIGEQDHIIERDFDVEIGFLDQFYDLIPENIQQQDSKLLFEATEIENFLKKISLFFSIFFQNKKYRPFEELEVKETSGIQWFEVKGEAHFTGNYTISLPQLLKGLKKGNQIYFQDGSVSFLPQNLFNEMSSLAEASIVTDDHIRLFRAQAIFLNQSNNGNSESNLKYDSIKVNKCIQDLSNPGIKKSSPLFKGTLREYQKRGLHWMHTLRENNLGGILADDMGLGKTIQVLAHLTSFKQKQPHLIVAPKSLLINWQNEILKFTPHLKVLILSGNDRKNHITKISEYNLVLVTYQTLLRDIETMTDITFDTVVYDEAHYVKNMRTLSHRSCQALQSAQRLLLTGTPVENSLDDLAALLGLANPSLNLRITNSSASAQRLSRGIRPFLLRRKKSEVLKDLPEKTEQLIYCEMSPAQQKHYTELETYYRTSLQKNLFEKGLSQSKFLVLEALLRLRQVAIHPALIDKNPQHDSCKFEVLKEIVQNISQEGHKTLIFSQFTSALQLLRVVLDDLSIDYCYLDGQTNNRQACVDDFQNQASKKVFLMSLKAGGVGLNLTAASYVIVLDPWWNPAAESQAIDRAHRMGQKNKVMAYKLITKNTVEEKIIELQKAKNKLVSELFEENTDSLIKDLRQEDIDYLFGAT